MRYDFRCTCCATLFEADVRMADRDEALGCPDCGGVAQRDLMATLQNARVVVQMDAVTIMERKYGDNPSWQGPTVDRPSSDSAPRSRAGTRRTIFGAQAQKTEV